MAIFSHYLNFELHYCRTISLIFYYITTSNLPWGDLLHYLFVFKGDLSCPSISDEKWTLRVESSSCYHFTTTRQTQPNAARECHRLNANLTSITSEAENQFISNNPNMYVLGFMLYMLMGYFKLIIDYLCAIKLQFWWY